MPMLYHNTETNHTQSFELECDMLLYACISHGMLITLEYDDADNSGGSWYSGDSNNIHIRFTQINSSDPTNVQLSQIGDRKNIKDMGFQIPNSAGLDRFNLTSDRYTQTGTGETYGMSGGGDWLSFAPNANKDIFSVLIT